MDTVLQQKVDRFRALPRELRLQALLAHANRFPDLPSELADRVTAVIDGLDPTVIRGWLAASGE